MTKKRIILITVILAFTIGWITYSQDTQGFFLHDLKPKKVSIPAFEDYRQPSDPATANIIVYLNDTIANASKYIYGSNSNVYMSQMVCEPKLINYIRNLSPKILRYPGGNLSNNFFWNAEKGQLPEDVPDTLLYQHGDKKPGSYWYGKNKDTLTMSVDNYYEMLKQTGSTGIICVNAGYARYGTGPTPVQTAAHLAAEWVRFDKGRTKFWEIGNENYGPWQAGFIIDTTKNKDGQPKYISGELYGRQFKVFADSMRAAAKEIKSEIYLGAVIVELPKGPNYYNPVEAEWNEGFFKSAGDYADFFAIHSYYTPWNENSTPETILNTAKSVSFEMMEYMKKMCVDYKVKLKPVALTEWNIFAIGSKQSCSYINGIHATLVLGELIKNKYGMATRWDLVNRYAEGNDHGMFNYGDEPGVPRWNPRPVYFYMYYFNKTVGDIMINSTVSGSENIICYASRFSSGQAGIVVVNKGNSGQIIKLEVKDFNKGDRYYFYSLTGGIDNGVFSQQVYINGYGPDYLTGGPINSLENIKAFSAPLKDEIKIASPAYSVQYLIIDNKKNN